MKVFIFTSLVSLAGAISLDLNKRTSPLDVKLQSTGNTAVKVVVTNIGAEDLKVLKLGTFLDEKSSVEKAKVFRGGSQVAFDGLRLRIATNNLEEALFQTIKVGQMFETSFDIAANHDLGAGGAFDIVTEGSLSYAEVGSTELAGTIPFSSNVVRANVDGIAAAKIRRAFLDRRAAVQSDCTGSRRTATLNALTNCRTLAQAAASAANSNAAKMTEYFKSSAASTRSTVAGVFNRVASECGSSTSGVSRYYCTDIYGACSSNVLAYTLPSSSQMVNCNLYFTGLPALSRTCHAQDQATTSLHESTHLRAIKGTDDYGTYGYNGVRGLTAAQNLNHADTYTLFAQAIYAGC